MKKPEFSMYTSKYDPRLRTNHTKSGFWEGAWLLLASLIVLAGLLAAIYMIIVPASAHAQNTSRRAPVNTQRLLLGVEAAQVRDALAARCISSGWSIEEATDNQIRCSHAANTAQSIFNTPMSGAGRAPRWFIRFSYARLPGENPIQLRIGGEVFMQTYSFTGQEGQRVEGSRSDLRVIENALYDLERLCTEPCGQ